LYVSRNSFVRLTFLESLLLRVEDQSEVAALSSIDWIKSLHSSRGEVLPKAKDRDYGSRSDSYRASPMLRDRAHGKPTA